MCGFQFHENRNSKAGDEINENAEEDYKELSQRRGGNFRAISNEDLRIKTGILDSEMRYYRM